MRKYSNLLMSGCVMIAVALTISACKDDDPPAKPNLSFEATSKTVKESDGVVQVKLILDKPAGEDITIDYSIDGTAVESVVAANTRPSDYEITSDYGEVEIAKGETEGIIELELISDSDLEDDETIEFSIESVSSEDILIAGTTDDIKITLQQEDGLLVILQWGEENVTYPDVDMDLFLWAPNASGTLVPTGYQGYANANESSLVGGSNPIEFMFVPTSILDDGTYGIGCTYYSGTKEPMKFQVTYVEIINSDDAATTTAGATYTLANINKYDEEDAALPLLAGTFKKTGADFSDFSSLTVAASLSRQSFGGTLPEFKRTPGGIELSPRIKSFLKVRK